ncbi:MAG: tetratricopeptide repeat protein [Phycisphaerales bacterium]|nr:tetratricopeptide repeat protein [Phycisphaerales bacterium]
MIRYYIRLHILLTLLLVLSISLVYGQSTKIYNDVNSQFKQARGLFQEEKYSLVYPILNNIYFHVIKSGTNETLSYDENVIPEEMRSEFFYYYFTCKLKLQQQSAAETTKKYIKYHIPSDPWQKKLVFQLAEYFFETKKYTEALQYYRDVQTVNLNNRELAQMNFHEGYCFFVDKKMDSAKTFFYTITQIPKDPFYVDAQYYYGYILFYEKDYDQALTSFTAIADKKQYNQIVSYYITEIYYITGNVDSALSTALTALQTEQFYKYELNKIVGNIYYEKKQFQKALPYLETYISNTPKVKKEDLYELSFCYYKSKNWDKAIEGFKELAGSQDSLSQNSMYLLADVYLTTDQKEAARNAFLFCAQNSSLITQKGIALFNYGKLSYELDYRDVAINTFRKFIAEFPKSPYVAEAQELLIDLMASTNNYQDALTLFNSLDNPSNNIKKVYPKLLYNRATELINDQNFEEADSLLTIIFKVPNNTNYLSGANFWKGEIEYQQQHYTEAIPFLKSYLDNKPTSAGECMPMNGQYNLAYAYFQIGNYNSALKYFLMVVKGTDLSNTSPVIIQDAYMRTGDCYYMMRDYTNALQYYELIINKNLITADIALFQNALILGALNQPEDKIKMLYTFSSRYPSSSLISDAYLEIANTFLADEDYKNAITPLTLLLQTQPAPSLLPQIYFKLGVAYFNTNQNSNALGSFNVLMDKYPNATESNNAIEYIRDIYIQNNTADSFTNYMQAHGRAVSNNEQDSITYLIANTAYQNNNIDQAITAFKDYLSKFPSGNYNLDANFNLANLLLNKKEYTKALPYFVAVVNKSPNLYVEPSILALARIYYFQNKDYAKAEEYYTLLKNTGSSTNQLEALRGLVRVEYKLEEWSKGATNAQDMLSQPNAANDDKMIAHMIVAKNYQQQQAYTDAVSSYKKVISLGNSEYSAQANYQIASMLYDQEKYKEAEKVAQNIIKQIGSYDYWLTKTYILLGMIYFKEKDYFNAQATMQSIIDNADIPELKQIAQDDLKLIIDEKNKNSKIDNEPISNQ